MATLGTACCNKVSSCSNGSRKTTAFASANPVATSRSNSSGSSRTRMTLLPTSTPLDSSTGSVAYWSGRPLPVGTLNNPTDYSLSTLSSSATPGLRESLKLPRSSSFENVWSRSSISRPQSADEQRQEFGELVEKHDPPDRVRILPPPQRHPFPSEPVHNLSLRGALSRKERTSPKHAAANSGRRSWLA